MSVPIQLVPVFVSSTWLDLLPERKAVEAVIHRLRETKFVGMEYISSRGETTRQASLDEVDRSSVFIGIFAGRYGSGITEVQYRRARERGLPCLIYFKDDATIPSELRETDPARAAKLDALKHELRASHTIGPDFKSPEDLAAKVSADLHRWLFENYLTPKLQDALRGSSIIPPSRIFISYRRGDSTIYARTLYDRLVAHFGEERVFMDIDTIEPGDDFVDVITQAVSSCAILIALIGKGWVNAVDEAGQRRLDNPDDFVNLEVTTALGGGIRVIPVLIQGTSMPRAAELPEPLKALARRNALEISDTRWSQDVGQLIKFLEKRLQEAF
jgi:TIR domain/Domain of unknown function (DUF4062)